MPAFFIREKPTSRNRKPTCMNMTSTAATTTQVVSIAGMASLRVGSMTHMVENGALIRHAPGVQDSAAGVVQSGWRTATRRAARRGPSMQLGQLARVHAEEAVGVARGRPDARVVEQLLVEEDRQVVPERRHAADREAGGGAHLVGLGLADLGHVERVGDLLHVHAVPPGRHAHDGVAVRHEHDRLRDLSLLAADGGGGVGDRARGGLQPLHLHSDPKIAGALREPVPHARTAWPDGAVSAVSSTPAASASSASDSLDVVGEVVEVPHQVVVAHEPEVDPPGVGEERDAERLVLRERDHRERVDQPLAARGRAGSAGRARS